MPGTIADDIGTMFPDANMERLAGATRYATSAAIARKFFPDPAAVTIATGVNFPDGLTGGSLAYGLKAPLILTREKNMNLAAQYAQAAGVKKFVVFGGEGAVSEKVVSTIVGEQAAPSRGVR